MATKLASLWKNLGGFALNKKKLAAFRVRRDRCRCIKSDVRWVSGVLACTVQSSVGDRHQGFFKEKIAGHAKVGIEELRCTDGAGETTTPTV